MANDLHFADKDQLRKWLSEHPREYAQAIAVRAALRSLPQAYGDGADRYTTEMRERVFLGIFRAIFIGSVAIGLVAMGEATEPMKRAVHAAAANADAYATAANTVHATNTVKAAADAAVYAAYAYAYAYADTPFVPYSYIAAVYAAAAADDAFAKAASFVIWTEVSLDAQTLAAGASVAEVLRRPLWGSVQAVPDEARAAWDYFKANPRTSELNFAPWITWYEALVSWNSEPPCDLFGKALSLKIALQKDEWWNRGAAAVNADVALWLANKPPPMDKATKAKTMADLNNRYFSERAKKAAESVERHLRQGDQDSNKRDGVQWVDAVAELQNLLRSVQ